MKQQTLKSEFSVKGKGLHTGLDIEAIFMPAPENHGYKFQRIDLEGQPIVDALAEFVTQTNRGTVLARGEVKVSTVEHALAALYAAGIDNCLIKVNAPELPILDGSAKEYCEKIEQVGLAEQNAEKDYYIVKQKIEVRDDTTGASIVALPDDELSLDVMVEFESPTNLHQSTTLPTSPKKSAQAVHLFSFAKLSPWFKPTLSKVATLTTPSSSTIALCHKNNSTISPIS
jgi:UDP-3-O-[3-hydroxymyristoyl] N-acetylglucosamine deacetylase/3-hydroxyacyl-[acyl-carrier-protein] dehydratase